MNSKKYETIIKGNYNLFPKKFMVEVISNDPKIYYIHNFVTEEEADYMIEICKKYKEESTVEVSSDKIIIEKKLRTSSTAFLKKGMTDVISRIENRAANFTNVSYDYIEPLQCVVYKNDEYYKQHLDTFNPNSIFLSHGGNRVGTIFVYLTTLQPEEEGCTYFPVLKHKIRPVKCNAIYFENIKDGKVDERLIHEGETVKGFKKKYGINIWIRESKYSDI
jgi:hypothetical protein